MKRQLWLCAVAACAVVLPSLTGSAAFTETVNAGYLYSTPYTGSPTPGTLNNGALLLLIAAGGNNGTTFTANPPAGSFVAGGDVILGSSSFNTGFGTGGTNGAGGATQSGFTNLASVAAGATVYIELRWYPNITLTQYSGGAMPIAGSYFGAYNPLATNSSNNTTLNPDGNDAWIQQASGAHTVNFYTTDLTAAPSHTQNVTEGYANFLVPASVPEPSAGTLGSLGLVVVVGMTRLWRRS